MKLLATIVMSAALVVACVCSSSRTVFAQARTPVSPGALSTQDYIDVQQLYARYAHALDSFEREGAG